MEIFHIFTVIILVILSVVSAFFFTSSEVSIFSTSRTRINHLVNSKVKNSEILKEVREHKYLLVIILIGTEISIIFGTTLAADTAIEIFGDIGSLISIVVMSWLFVTFSEIMGESYAIGNEKWALKISKFIKYVIKILYPFGVLLDTIGNSILKFFKIEKQENKKIGEEEIISMATIGEEEGVVLSDEKDFIENIFEFKDISVKEVMRHRTMVKGIDINNSDDEIKFFLMEIPYSRIPVYEDNIDNIKGIINTQNVLAEMIKNKGKQLNEIIKEKIQDAYVIPKTKNISDAFKDLQSNGIRTAIVIDEYGGTAGIVTVDDLVEEIVGEMPEIWETNTTIVLDKDRNIVLFSGVTEIEDAGEFFNENIEPDGDYRTLAGCIITKLGRLPKKGEGIDFKNFRFIADKLERNKIKTVKVIHKKQEREEQT
ncbi:putative Integral membrane protein with CBS domains [groundwater metagenome]|uniref:Putative Integral membrane protein with CBS domains n=1 Tax=groundwater metagenome TaxID=717931 RepID=A0A098E877_9ZZZZ